MTSLDEISFKLGELTHSVKALNARAERGEDNFEAIKLSISKIESALQPVVADVASMKPHVDHYKRVRRWGASVAAGILALAGSSGGALSTWLMKKLGG